ncbi:hypothetical protein LINPERHAP2_LOCUS5688 [Linum perenne]
MTVETKTVHSNLVFQNNVLEEDRHEIDEDFENVTQGIVSENIKEGVVAPIIAMKEDSMLSNKENVAGSGEASNGRISPEIPDLAVSDLKACARPLAFSGPSQSASLDLVGKALSVKKPVKSYSKGQVKGRVKKPTLPPKVVAHTRINVEPKISQHKAEAVIKKMGFSASFRSDAVGFVGGIWLVWDPLVIKLDI